MKYWKYHITIIHDPKDSHRALVSWCRIHIGEGSFTVDPTIGQLLKDKWYCQRQPWAGLSQDSLVFGFVNEDDSIRFALAWT